VEYTGTLHERELTSGRNRVSSSILQKSALLLQVDELWFLFANSSVRMLLKDADWYKECVMEEGGEDMADRHDVPRTFGRTSALLNHKSTVYVTSYRVCSNRGTS
jgi:hypothetical protein